KKAISSIVNDLAEHYPNAVVAASLDALKDVGCYWATRSGLTIATSDVATPLEKTEILDAYETRANKVQAQYDRGLLTDDERRQVLVEMWHGGTDKDAEAQQENIIAENSV